MEKGSPKIESPNAGRQPCMYYRRKGPEDARKTQLQQLQCPDEEWAAIRPDITLVRYRVGHVLTISHAGSRRNCCRQGKVQVTFPSCDMLDHWRQRPKEIGSDVLSIQEANHASAYNEAT